jgi:hypothetical protein
MNRRGEYTASGHFLVRMHQRKLSGVAIEATLRYGTDIYQRGGGCAARVLLRKNIPACIDHESARKMIGTVVILSEDNVLVTAYRLPGVRPSVLRKKRFRSYPG